MLKNFLSRYSTRISVYTIYTETSSGELVPCIMELCGRDKFEYKKIAACFDMREMKEN